MHAQAINSNMRVAPVNLLRIIRIVNISVADVYTPNKSSLAVDNNNFPVIAVVEPIGKSNK